MKVTKDQSNKTNIDQTDNTGNFDNRCVEFTNRLNKIAYVKLGCNMHRDLEVNEAKPLFKELSNYEIAISGCSIGNSNKNCAKSVYEDTQLNVLLENIGFYDNNLNLPSSFENDFIKITVLLKIYDEVMTDTQKTTTDFELEDLIEKQKREKEKKKEQSEDTDKNITNNSSSTAYAPKSSSQTTSCNYHSLSIIILCLVVLLKLI